MWSAWAWVRRMRTIGAPMASAAAMILPAEPPIIVSITVSPSFSRTRYAFTNPNRLTRFTSAIAWRG